MSFSWEDFAVLAGELLEASDRSQVPQAAIRTSLGRSYYALFGVARDLLRERGCSIRRESEHAGVRRALSESSDEIERHVGAALVELFRWRATADYNAAPGVPLTRELAEHACSVSRSAIEALQASRN